mmetsp:Transcript_7398/g.18826  ORF Transcript_7398/g.18826 Transcript_7398/m.18826 type:complete len:354 (-) Transcript_7398:838-1899(-)
MVPVLSSAMVSTPAAASNTSPPRSSSPSLAPADVATSTAVGVARPSAQGHATTSTSVASLSAPSTDPAPPDASISAPGNTASPARLQKAKVEAEAAMTAYTNGPATASARRWTGAARACASATVRAMPAATLPSPAVVALTVRGPSKTPVPAETRSPAVFGTNSGSPVSVASSTAAAPATTSPSTGTTSPGNTRTMSPGRSASRSTITVITGSWSPSEEDSSATATAEAATIVIGTLLAMTSLASSGSRVESERRSEAALARARPSSARPSRMKARSNTGSSKKSLLTGMPYSPTTAGVRAPATERPKAAHAPTPTSEFMLGAPLPSALNPSRSIPAPGPASASAAMAAPTHG